MKKPNEWIRLDNLLATAKRWQRKYYLADYEDERLRRQWLSRAKNSGYEEVVFPVAPKLSETASILVFKPDEIGDAVHSLPAIYALRKSHPKAKLSLICQAKTAPVFERTGLFDEIATVEVRMKWLRFPEMDLSAALSDLSTQEFDLSIFLRTYPVYFQEFLEIPSRQKLHPRDPRLESRSPYQANVSQWGDERKHQAVQMLEIVSGVTELANEVSFPKWNWTEADRRSLEIVFPGGAPKSYGVIHPFARYETRRYPIEYWTRLLDGVCDRFPIPWVIIGGAEDPILPEISGVIQVQGKLALAETGYLLSRAGAYLGNESGPGHWAAALGVPTATLMGGHSFPAEWAPLGTSKILRAEVPCAPCHRRECPGYGLVCLKELTPEKVLPHVLGFFEPALSAAAPRPKPSLKRVPHGEKEPIDFPPS